MSAQPPPTPWLPTAQYAETSLLLSTEPIYDDDMADDSVYPIDMDTPKRPPSGLPCISGRMEPHGRAEPTLNLGDYLPEWDESVLTGRGEKDAHLESLGAQTQWDARRGKRSNTERDDDGYKKKRGIPLSPEKGRKDDFFKRRVVDADRRSSFGATSRSGSPARLGARREASSGSSNAGSVGNRSGSAGMEFDRNTLGYSELRQYGQERQTGLGRETEKRNNRDHHRQAQVEEIEEIEPPAPRSALSRFLARSSVLHPPQHLPASRIPRAAPPNNELSRLPQAPTSASVVIRTKSDFAARDAVIPPITAFGPASSNSSQSSLSSQPAISSQSFVKDNPRSTLPLSTLELSKLQLRIGEPAFEPPSLPSSAFRTFSPASTTESSASPSIPSSASSDVVDQRGHNAAPRLAYGDIQESIRSVGPYYQPMSFEPEDSGLPSIPGAYEQPRPLPIQRPSTTVSPTQSVTSVSQSLKASRRSSTSGKVLSFFAGLLNRPATPTSAAPINQTGDADLQHEAGSVSKVADTGNGINPPGPSESTQPVVRIKRPAPRPVHIPGYRAITQPGPIKPYAAPIHNPRPATRPLHPCRTVPSSSTANPRSAKTSAFASAALARLPAPGKGSSSSSRPTTLTESERAADISSRRARWEHISSTSSAANQDTSTANKHKPDPNLAARYRPGQNMPSLKPHNPNIPKTIPLSGRTPGKASLLRAKEREAFDQVVKGKMAQKEKRDKEDKEKRQREEEEEYRKKRKETVIWARPVPEVYKTGKGKGDVL